MTVTTNEAFTRLLQVIGAMGDKANQRASDSPIYREFIAAFPLSRLPTLSADEYCIGKGADSFCRWLERGLEPVLGRYMPGTSRGHIVYFRKEDGSLYKHRHLQELSDDDALRYTLKVQHAIASANPADDIRWIDERREIFRHAGVEPRVSVGDGRKLRLLVCYHPEDVVLISSSDHLAHFLAALGCPKEEIPENGRPIARMLKLREYFSLARQSCPELTTLGFMRALYSSEFGMAPERHTDEGAEDDEDEPSPAYLLTWNPEHFKLGSDGEVTPGSEHRWTCRSRQPKIGDTVYLARLGIEPRGIIAKGTVTQESQQAPHWKDPSKRARYIRFRLDEFRPDAISGLLPMLLLALAIPDQKWSPQGSGVGIPAHAEQLLAELWKAGEHVHSLRQFVDWFASSVASSLDRWNDWLEQYRTTTTLAQTLQGDPLRIDERALSELWLSADNGVSHVGPGRLSSKEFADNLPLLDELARLILVSPTTETLSVAETKWKQAVDAKKLRSMNRAVIRRVFAAASPTHYTTLLRESDCQKILALLSRQFEVQPVRSAGTDWVGLNADLVSCMRQAHLDPNRSVENNLAVWRLVEYLAAGERPSKASATTLDQPDPVEASTPQVPPRNLVLYGPPGTGKTYQTIEEAISILAPEMLEGEPDRTALKARFDELVAEDRIVFTTFHQSFSYEDFVEGLRAETTADGQLRYTVVDGVFKRLCSWARGEDDVHSRSGALPFAPGDHLSGYEVLRCTADILELRKPHGSELPLGMTLIRQLADLVRSGQIDVEDIKGKRVFEKVPDTKLEKFLVNGYSNVLPALVERMLTAGKQAVPASTPGRATSPHVLIIDEINRGNVARIFGELITLIEPSKRAGMPESLTVTLPYSKTRFSVPANVHIIGTMNTADRSLVGLDIALRRRFEFRELQPRPDLLDDVSVEGISIGALLRAMNDRIEALLDRDHRLGHAYFLGLRETPTVHALAHVFTAHILPLLQEYFFEDWERICWVLNDHRKPSGLRFVSTPVDSADRLFGDGVSLPTQGARWVVNEAAFLLPDSYAGVLSVPS